MAIKYIGICLDFYSIFMCESWVNKTKEILIEEAIIAYFNKLDEELSDKRIHDIKFAKYPLFSLEDIIKNIGLEKC